VVHVAARVLRDVHRPALPDDGHLHLARVLELVLDLAGDLVGEEDGAVVVDLAGPDGSSGSAAARGPSIRAG
jgi:hypothetical protein